VGENAPLDPSVCPWRGGTDEAGLAMTKSEGVGTEGKTGRQDQKVKSYMVWSCGKNGR